MHLSCLQAYSKPTVTNDLVFKVKGAVHPVVSSIQQSTFVSNDCDMDEHGLWIVTGPNMGGTLSWLPCHPVQVYLNCIRLNNRCMCIFVYELCFICRQKYLLTTERSYCSFSTGKIMPFTLRSIGLLQCYTFISKIKVEKCNISLLTLRFCNQVFLLLISTLVNLPQRAILYSLVFTPSY